MMEEVKKESRKKDLVRQRKIIEKIKKMGERYLISDEYLRATNDSKDNQMNIIDGGLEIIGESPNNSPSKGKEAYKPPASGFSTISY